ncbi:MAG: hypothetical protein MK096_09605 [Oleiphilaceae bacterium]|nr:hypothetical protein [Oleiphilaceae bacterium]
MNNFIFCPEIISRLVFYPVWDMWDRSKKLSEYHSLMNSQWESRDTLQNDQENRVRELLLYASEYSPYYKDLFSDNNIDLQNPNFTQLIHSVPVTKKQDLRNNIDRFISNEFKKEELINAKTGGSTGFSLDLFFDKRCQEKRNAAAMRTDKWAGWEAGKVRGDLWGNPKLPKSVKQKIRNCLLDKIIYLDTMKLSDHSMSRFVERVRNYGVEVIFGHAHSIFLLAKFIDSQKLMIPPMTGVISTSMMLIESERKLIERVFSCKVTNRYGCEEVGLIASECELHEGLHVNMEHVFVEIVNEQGEAVKDGEVGKVLVTDLNNHAMPLIRYQVEDMAVATSRQCSCGRGSQLIEGLSGRVADFLKLSDGSSVAGISLIERTLTKVIGIEQMQIVQKKLDEIEINRVKGRDFTDSSDQELMAELSQVFGEEVKIRVIDVDRIPQEKNGKYRFSICQL